MWIFKMYCRFKTSQYIMHTKVYFINNDIDVDVGVMIMMTPVFCLTVQV